MQGHEIPLAVIVLNEHENRTVRISVKMLHNGGVNFGVGFVAMRIEKDGAGNNRFKRLDLGKGRIRNKVLVAINNDELDHIFETDGMFED